MLAGSRDRILGFVRDDALVLDVGGWASPFARADCVIDLMPYGTRGLYGDPDPLPERFSAATWHERDICDHEPWPFADHEFDFVVCSHTLEDVRDPIRVCAEINRVGKAGYIEVPARVEEQTYGVHGPWVGWSHHHWLVDVDDNTIRFVLKPHLLHGRREFWVNLAFTRSLPPERLVSTMFWEGEFQFSERIFYEPEDLHDYLREIPAAEGPHARVWTSEPRSVRARLRALRRASRRTR